MAFYQAPTSYQQQQHRQQQQTDNVLPPVEDIVDFLQTYPEVDFPQSQPAYLKEVTTTTTKPTAGNKRARDDELGLKEYAVVAKN